MEMIGIYNPFGGTNFRGKTIMEGGNCCCCARRNLMKATANDLNSTIFIKLTQQFDKNPKYLFVLAAAAVPVHQQIHVVHVLHRHPVPILGWLLGQCWPMIGGAIRRC